MPLPTCFPRARSTGALFLVTVLGCAPAAGTDDLEAADVGSVRQAQTGEFYDTGFGPSTSNYLPPKTIVLTFDDGPDWGAEENTDYKKGFTWQILDILEAESVTATFLVNRDNWSSLDDPEMRETVFRMAKDGHEVGSHGWHHYSIGQQSAHPYWDPGNEPADFIATDLTEQQIDDELTKVEEVMDEIFGAGKVRMTLFRAPYGEPFQTGAGTLDLAKSVVSRHAVHIGWNLDTFDYSCGTTTCAKDNVINGLATTANNSAIVLAHSVQANMVAALPDLLRELKEDGYTFWTTEQAVCAKFGKYSKDLVDGTESDCDQNDPQPRPRADLGGGPGGDGSTGDGDGDGSSTDGSSGDGDGDGNGNGNDGSSGDGDGDGDGNGNGGDGDGDGEGGGKVVTVEKGCSVGMAQNPGLAFLFTLGLGGILVRRRRR